MSFELFHWPSNNVYCYVTQNREITLNQGKTRFITVEIFRIFLIIYITHTSIFYWVNYDLIHFYEFPTKRNPICAERMGIRSSTGVLKDNKSMFDWHRVFLFIGCTIGFYGRNCTSPCRYLSFGMGCQELCQCLQEICNNIYGCSMNQGQYVYLRYFFFKYCYSIRGII